MRKRILIIDDEVSTGKSFLLSLEEDGYEVSTAPSGEEGIRSIRTQCPDLVFLDFKMPSVNGVDTLREIRKIDANLPVYVITAFFKEFLDGLGAAAKQGIQFNVLNKPIESHQIRTLTKAVLEKTSDY